MFLSDQTPEFVPQCLNRKHCFCRVGATEKKTDFGPCIRMLIVHKFQDVLLNLIELHNHAPFLRN